MNNEAVLCQTYMHWYDLYKLCKIVGAINGSVKFIYVFLCSNEQMNQMNQIK